MLDWKGATEPLARCGTAPTRPISGMRGIREQAGVIRTLHAYPSLDPRDGLSIPFDRCVLCVLECT